MGIGSVLTSGSALTGAGGGSGALSRSGSVAGSSEGVSDVGAGAGTGVSIGSLGAGSGARPCSSADNLASCTGSTAAVKVLEATDTGAGTAGALDRVGVGVVAAGGRLACSRSDFSAAVP